MVAIYVGVFLLVVFVVFRHIADRRRRIKDKKLLETVTTLSRGTRTERNLVLKLLKSGMPAETIFHDLYVQKPKGDFSQIDLVAIMEVGIVVFEVKEYSGWLFGSGNQSLWTQVLGYGQRKYRFYNPIMQNNRHVTELKNKLKGHETLPFYSIIVFYGDCVLKEINFVPNGTFLVKSEKVLDVVRIILEENKTVDYTNKNEVIKVLNEAVTNGGIIENQVKHKENIEDMLGKHRIFD